MNTELIAKEMGMSVDEYIEGLNKNETEFYWGIDVGNEIIE